MSLKTHVCPAPQEYTCAHGIGTGGRCSWTTLRSGAMSTIPGSAGGLEEIRIQLEGIGHALSEGSLFVPKNQRSYAWEESHVSDLFKDIATALARNDNEYFLGSVVVAQRSERQLEVVDGQQRLATTSVLLAA